MRQVACIVEGDGEVSALPLLLRRINEWQTPEQPTLILPPIRVQKDRFLNRPNEFRRFVLLAASKCGDEGWILIVFDADDDCPVVKHKEVLAQAQAIARHKRVAVVMANREYEAWLMASAPSLHGHRGFQWQGELSAIPFDAKRDAKGWIQQRMGGASYGISDQVALTKHINLATAFKNSRSFRKLCSEWVKHTPNTMIEDTS